MSRGTGFVQYVFDEKHRHNETRMEMKKGK
jgi:hypothetical protein